jgi:hypothetical protein
MYDFTQNDSFWYFCRFLCSGNFIIVHIHLSKTSWQLPVFVRTSVEIVNTKYTKVVYIGISVAFSKFPAIVYERISGFAGFARNPPIGAAFCVLPDFWDVRQLSYFEYERSNAIGGYGEGMDIGQGRAAPVLRNLVTFASIARLDSTKYHTGILK